jgi:rod shape-determining protein MreC
MPVITPDGIVGKVFRVYPTSSLVLEINDSSSGAGVILEKSRLQGILKGSPTGQTFVANIMADEKIQPGERILTSGGDRVYPKGMAVGTVSRVNPAGTFLNVEVKPSAKLNGLEEVLVITKIVEKAPEVNDASAPVRAIDILAQRLPSVPPPKPAPATAQPKPAATPAKPNAGAAPPPAVPPETAGQSSTAAKPAPAAEKNAASAKAVVEAAKPETTVKDTPR